jgi:hypothetical protein
MKKAIAAIGMLVLLVACSKQEQAAAAPAVPANPNQLAGPVAETFNGGGYTYLRIGDQWAAIPETKIEQGSNVTIDKQMTMEKFESKSLNRTFDRIVFGSLAGAAPVAMPPAPVPVPVPAAADATPAQRMQAPDAGPIQVQPPAGGKTVQQIWAEKAALGGKEVLVRGKVVKFLPGIMGTNWLHLQDGTGSREAGDHDLTVTTDATVSVGDIVTARGLLAVDKDFGSGYRYAAIVEKAAITK